MFDICTRRTKAMKITRRQLRMLIEQEVKKVVVVNKDTIAKAGELKKSLEDQGVKPEDIEPTIDQITGTMDEVRKKKKSKKRKKKKHSLYPYVFGYGYHRDAEDYDYDIDAGDFGDFGDFGGGFGDFGGGCDRDWETMLFLFTLF